MRLACENGCGIGEKRAAFVHGRGDLKLAVLCRARGLVLAGKKEDEPRDVMWRLLPKVLARTRKFRRSARNCSQEPIAGVGVRIACARPIVLRVCLKILRETWSSQAIQGQPLLMDLWQVQRGHYERSVHSLHSCQRGCLTSMKSTRASSREPLRAILAQRTCGMATAGLLIRRPDDWPELQFPKPGLRAANRDEPLHGGLRE
jgi:hypothetical protein